MVKRKSYHEVLKEIEAERLRKKGFQVEFEKKLCKGCRVDVYAKKGEDIIIVECGGCQRGLETPKKFANKVIHVTYLPLWFRYEPWKTTLEEMRNHAVNTPYSWKEQLKDVRLKMDFDWIDKTVDQIKGRIGK